jgi:hypothetical protein
MHVQELCNTESAYLLALRACPPVASMDVTAMLGPRPLTLAWHPMRCLGADPQVQQQQQQQQQLQAHPEEKSLGWPI